MMGKRNFFMFILGIVVGSTATYLYLDKKYKQISQDEINSVKEVFSKREEDPITKEKKVDNSKGKPNIVEYANMLKKQGYTNYSDINDGTSKKEIVITQEPYVIAPEDFGAIDGYDTIGLIYYSDKILSDEEGELVEDINNVVGFDSLTTFGKYEDDSVFVRNDRLKCDYEILFDQRTFSSIIRRKPHEVDD